MPRLNRQDGTGSSEENGVGKEDRTTEVGSDTNVLHNSSGCGHSRNIGKSAIELELAAGDGCFTKGFQSSLWSWKQILMIS